MNSTTSKSLKKIIAMLTALVFMLSAFVFVFTGCASNDAGNGQADGAAETTDQTEETPVTIDYESAIVSYLGPEGTYTEAACERFFEEKGEYIHTKPLMRQCRRFVMGRAVMP